jgi:hypothetical protein
VVNEQEEPTAESIEACMLAALAMLESDIDPDTDLEDA